MDLNLAESLYSHITEEEIPEEPENNITPTKNPNKKSASEISISKKFKINQEKEEKEEKENLEKLQDNDVYKYSFLINIFQQ